MNVIYRGDHVIEDAASVALLDGRVNFNHEVAHVAQHQVHYNVNVLLVLIEVV